MTRPITLSWSVGRPTVRGGRPSALEGAAVLGNGAVGRRQLPMPGDEATADPPAVVGLDHDVVIGSAVPPMSVVLRAGVGHEELAPHVHLAGLFPQQDVRDMM